MYYSDTEMREEKFLSQPFEHCMQVNNFFSIIESFRERQTCFMQIALKKVRENSKENAKNGMISCSSTVCHLPEQNKSI